MKTKTYTPYPIAPNEKEFDLILEQQKKHKSNKSGESIEISDISKNNMNQSRSAVSAIQNETENEHMIQRRNTAQRLINDPKLQQIRMFMERYKPKKKEDGNNSNTMFKRSKSTMVTSDTVNSLKKLSRNIHDDNEGLQVIKEKTEDNEDTSRSNTIKKRKMQLKHSKEIELDNDQNEESNSKKKVLKSRRQKEEYKEAIAPSLQDMITSNKEEQIEEEMTNGEDKGKHVLSPSLQDMIASNNEEESEEEIPKEEEKINELEKPKEEDIHIEENEEEEIEDKNKERLNENKEEEKIYVEENEEEELGNIKEEKENSTSHFITESDHLTKPNISNITPIQEEVSNLDNNIIMTENSLINPPSKKASKKTNVYSDIIEHTRVVLHQTGSRNFQLPTYHSNTIESYTQKKKEPLHDITFRDYSNKKPTQTSYRQYQYPSYDNKRLYYIYSDNELYNKISERQTNFDTNQIEREYTKPIIRSYRNNLSVNTNRDNIDFSYSNTNHFMRPSKRDFTYCNTNYTPYKSEVENLYWDTFKKSHFESTQYESPSRISNPSLTERESEDALCYKCRQELKQNRMLNLMTQ